MSEMETLDRELAEAEDRQRRIASGHTEEFKSNAQKAWDRQEPVNGVSVQDALDYFMDPTGMLRSGAYAALEAKSAYAWARVFEPVHRRFW